MKISVAIVLTVIGIVIAFLITVVRSPFFLVDKWLTKLARWFVKLTDPLTDYMKIWDMKREEAKKCSK